MTKVQPQRARFELKAIFGLLLAIIVTGAVAGAISAANTDSSRTARLVVLIFGPLRHCDFRNLYPAAVIRTSATFRTRPASPLISSSRSVQRPRSAWNS